VENSIDNSSSNNFNDFDNSSIYGNNKSITYDNNIYNNNGRDHLRYLFNRHRKNRSNQESQC